MKTLICRGIAPAVLILFLSGCVTSKRYRLAKPDTPAAVAVNWRAQRGDLAMEIQNVIVFRGPGSWKQEARWDEYVVRLANSGKAPLTVNSVELIDLPGNPIPAGRDPWVLEKLTGANWTGYGTAGLPLAAGAGAAVLYTGAVTAGASGAVLAGGVSAGSIAAINAIPVAAVVDVAVVARLNHVNKGKVEAEFSRRRWSLPATVQPGAIGFGSFFFPMTPGPREMVVHATRKGENVVVHLPLPGLARLHLQANPAGTTRRRDARGAAGLQ